MLAAPEVLTSARYDAKLADIWSAGVMLYTMLCCSYPFEKADDDPQDLRTQTKIMQRIMKGTELCPWRVKILGASQCYGSWSVWREGRSLSL